MPFQPLLPRQFDNPPKTFRAESDLNTDQARLHKQSVVSLRNMERSNTHLPDRKPELFLEAQHRLLQSKPLPSPSGFAEHLIERNAIHPWLFRLFLGLWCHEAETTTHPLRQERITLIRGEALW